MRYSKEQEKELYFANVVIGAIDNVKVPMLMCEEEKEVVKKALLRYIEQLENEVRRLDLDTICFSKEEAESFREPHVLYRDKNGVIEEEKECESDER